MIETYAFLAAFAAQILVGSVVHPGWFARYARMKFERYIADERYEQLYPGLNRAFVERFLILYRAVNSVIAALGLGLLGWLLSYMLRQDWDHGPVRHLLAGYSIVQLSPFILASLTEFWVQRKALTRSPPEVKRTASLQRRRLFEFVSPFTVFFAVLAYVLFATFMIYIQQQHPIPGFSGYRTIGNVTLVYALYAFLAYWMLYGKKSGPLETRPERMHAAMVGIKFLFYVSIGFVSFISLNIALKLLNLQRWQPFAMSVFFMIIMFFTSVILRHNANWKAGELRTSPAF